MLALTLIVRHTHCFVSKVLQKDEKVFDLDVDYQRQTISLGRSKPAGVDETKPVYVINPICTGFFVLSMSRGAIQP